MQLRVDLHAFAISILTIINTDRFNNNINIFSEYQKNQYFTLIFERDLYAK